MIDKLTANWVVIRAEFSHSTGTETRNLRCISEDVQTSPKMMRKRSFSFIKLPNSIGSQKKQGNSRKTSTSASLTTLKPLTLWNTAHCGKFLKRWEYQTTWPASWETCMQVRKQQLELDMEQQTGSKLRKEYDKVVYRHPAYLIYK